MSQNPENNNFNSKPNNFGLPKGYFQRSADSIFNKIEWVEEHKAFPALSDLKNAVKNNSGFIVPGAYFDNSESDLELIAYPHLLQYKAQLNSGGFIVPQDYFENAEVNELAKVIADSENELENFTKLNSIKKQNCFIVNEGHFANSEQKIISVLQPNARVISLFKPKIFFSAAAAIITIILGVWLYNQYLKPVKANDCGSLACLDKKELVKTKDLENLDNDELYELVNTKKLEEKLQNKTAKPADKKSIDSSLKNVSTDELLDEI